MSRVDSFDTYRLNLFGANLPKSSSAILYVGPDGDRVWKGLQDVGLRLVSVDLHETASSSHCELVQLVGDAARYAFDRYTSSGVYFVGHGIGAMYVKNLLADSDLLNENGRLERLRAAFLVSGTYELADDPWFARSSAKGFDHLWKPATRIYVFSAQNDSADLRMQSRCVFNKLSEYCDQNDMHYECKEGVDRADLLECMSIPNNFLCRLLRYDIARSQSRYY